MKRKKVICMIVGFLTGCALFASGCGSTGGTVNESVSVTASEGEKTLESADTSLKESIQESESEPEEITIATLGNIPNSKERLEKAKEFYEEIRENYNDNTESVVLLLKTMGECANGLTVDTSQYVNLKGKMDELMQSYHGSYCELGFKGGSGMAEITVCNDSGTKLALYDINNDALYTYGCTEATNVKAIDKAGKLNPKSGIQNNKYWWGRDLEMASGGLEFKYDEEGRPVSIKWKVYQLNANGTATSNWKWGEFTMTYRADGHLEKVHQGGYVWSEDKGGDYYEFIGADINTTFDSMTDDYEKIEILGCEDGSCRISVQNYASQPNYAITHRGVGEVQRFAELESGTLYYDMISKKITAVYSVEKLDNDFLFIRKFDITYKNQNKVIDKVTESTRYLVYDGQGLVKVNEGALLSQVY